MTNTVQIPKEIIINETAFLAAVSSEIGAVVSELGLMSSWSKRDIELCERLIRIEEAAIAMRILIGSDAAAINSHSLECYEALVEVGKDVISNEHHAA